MNGSIPQRGFWWTDDEHLKESQAHHSKHAVQPRGSQRPRNRRVKVCASKALGKLSIQASSDVTFRGLGALLAEKFAAEGCNVAINYNASQDRAKDIAAKIEKNHQVKTVVIQGVSLRCDLKSVDLCSLTITKDVGQLVDCERMVFEATKCLGGLDVIISNAVSRGF